MSDQVNGTTANKYRHGTCGCHLCRLWRVVYKIKDDGELVMMVVYQ